MSSAVWLTAITAGLIVLAHLLNPEISVRNRMLSELSLGTYGWVMDLAYIAWMIAHIVVARGLLPVVPVSLAFLLGLVGVFQGMAGYFRTDSGSGRRRPPSRARWLHNIAAVGYIIGFPVVILLLGISLWAGGYPLARRAIILAIPVWISFILFALLVWRWRRSGRDLLGDVPLGLPNRLFVLTYLLWLFGMAMRV